MVLIHQGADNANSSTRIRFEDVLLVSSILKNRVAFIRVISVYPFCFHGLGVELKVFNKRTRYGTSSVHHITCTDIYNND
jgi:hypothetical protein